MEKPELESSSPENDKSRKIGELEPIQLSRETFIEQRGDLKKIVEGPLLSACQELYDKNIITLSSSANRKDVERGAGHIIIDADALSEKNKEIAVQLGKSYFADGMHMASIEIPITADSTFQNIENAAQEIAHKFQKQRYHPTGTPLDEMRKAYSYDFLEGSTPEEFAKAFGMIYDSATDALFRDDERTRKAMDRKEIDE